ncbi:MAG: GAF domain-containing protein [Anaerolineaceae bacterium]|nr:MAG: GAF domain-containing protein [Anaerolineaceae bacterium]
MTITPYSILCFITSLLAAIVAGVAWKRRKVEGGLPLALLMTAVAEWSLGAAFEYATISIRGKVFWSVVQYAGSLSSPVFFLLFTIEYNRLVSWLRSRNVAFLFIVPVITWGLAVTNQWHNLIWTSFTPDPLGNNLIVYGHGIGFWIGGIGYSYLAMLGGTGLLVLAFFRLPPAYRRQTRLLLVGATAPWIGSLIYITGASPQHGLDLTPLMLVFTGVLLALGVFRLRLLDLVPLARNALVDTMPDGMIVLDEQDRVVDINSAAKRIFQLTEKNTFGEQIHNIIPGWASLAPGIQAAAETQVQFAPGGVVKEFLELNISPLRDRKGRLTGRLVIAHNIDQRKRAEMALQRRDAILQAVSLAAERFLSLETWEQSVPEVLAQIGKAAEVSRAYIFERFFSEEGGPFVSQRYEWVSEGITPQIENPDLQNLPYQSAGFGRWEEELTNHRPIFGVVSDFPESEKELLSAQNVLSIAVMPIFFEETCWGFIGFDDCLNERAWPEVELEALRAAADIFGAALARHRAESALHNRQRTLNLLHEIVRAALQASDLRKMSQTLVDRLGELIGADGCFLSLWDENARRAVPTAAYGPFRKTYSNLDIKPGEKTMTASVLRAGRTLVIEDTFHSPYLSPRIAKSFPAQSVLALPLIVGKSKLGAILLGFNQRHQFSKEEISIGEQAAGLIALTLAKFQAMEQAYHHAEESETLRKAGAAVAATLNADEAVNRILEQLEQVVPNDSASVQLLRDGTLEIVGGRGWPDPAAVIGIRFPVPGDNPNSLVIQSRQPYILEDADTSYPSFNNPPHMHIRSWLGVPLIVHQQVTGILAIDSSSPHHFTAAHARIASAFADHVAIALENARLFGEVQELALTDALTGAYNRRGLFELGHIEFARTRRFKRPFSAIMVDIDHFKRINDRYGHTVGGDPVLKALAGQCRESVREIDLVSRYGGEEFVILLPETDLATAREVAERLREIIANTQVQTTVGKLSITVSMGVAEYNDNTPNLETLIARADQAMYVAKHKGRNRVAINR